MQSPKVLNIRNPKNAKPFVYIGRPTIWGNPFEIGKDGTRQQVIEKYKRHLEQSPELLEQLYKLKGINLACWCAPKACHGDVLLKYANANPLF